MQHFRKQCTNGTYNPNFDDSELSNSARNGKKNSAADGGSCGTAAIFSVFRVATFNSKNFKKKLDH